MKQQLSNLSKIARNNSPIFRDSKGTILSSNINNSRLLLLIECVYWPWQQFYMNAREYTVRISVFFFLLFTPFSSYMTILTHIYEQADLPGIGPATLAVNYITFILSTIAAPACQAPLKLQLLFGGIFYTINYSSGIFAAMTDEAGLKFTISCLGSGLAGCSAGFLWVSMGRYIHLACQKYGVPSQKGQMYGIFSSIYCFSNVSAGLITTFGLGFFDAQVYFSIITALGILSVLFCLFFVNHITEKERNQSLLTDHMEQIQNQNALEVSESVSIITGNQGKAEEYNMWQVVKGTVAFIPIMYPVLLILVIDGLSLGIYSSEITHLIPPDTPSEDVNKIAGVTMITLGVGSTIGGFVSGIAADRTGTIVAGRLGLASVVLSCGCFLVALYQHQLWLTLLAGFMWGFSLFYVQGWMYVVCSRCYQGKPESFSVNKQLHSLFYLFFQIAVFLTDNKMPLEVLIGVLTALTVPGALLMAKVPNNDAFKKDQAESVS